MQKFIKDWLNKRTGQKRQALIILEEGRLDQKCHALSLEEVQESLAEFPDDLVIESLARSPQANIAWEIARYEEATPKALGTLSVHGSAEVRAAVAGNPKTPPEILERFIKMRDPQLMPLALAHANTAAAWLARGLEGPPRWIRAVASNPNISKEMAKELAQAADESVLVNLVRNPKIGAGALALVIDRVEDARGAEAKMIWVGLANRTDQDPDFYERLNNKSPIDLGLALLGAAKNGARVSAVLVALLAGQCIKEGGQEEDEIPVALGQALTVLESRAIDGDAEAALLAWDLWIRHRPLKAIDLYKKLTPARRAALGPLALAPLLIHENQEVRQRAHQERDYLASQG